MLTRGEGSKIQKVCRHHIWKPPWLMMMASLWSIDGDAASGDDDEERDGDPGGGDHCFQKQQASIPDIGAEREANLDLGCVRLPYNCKTLLNAKYLLRWRSLSKITVTKLYSMHVCCNCMEGRSLLHCMIYNLDGTTLWPFNSKVSIWTSMPSID